jgi:hypothetical protein
VDETFKNILFFLKSKVLHQQYDKTKIQMKFSRNWSARL